MVSKATLDIYSFQQVALPSKNLNEHGYSILDSEEG